VRYNFPLGGKKVDIVGGTNMKKKTLEFYTINEDGELTNVSGSPIKPNMFPFEWGFSFYHSQKTGKFYVLASSWGGNFEQYEIFDNGNGKIDGRLVRTFTFPSSLEGIVADDEYGYMYIGEENEAIYKYGAEPTDFRMSIVDTADGERLTADIEGLTIYYTMDGKGYLLVSSQGDSSYAVYRREGNNEYIGSFVIEDGEKIDGTYDTDGIDVVSWNLGEKFPHGLFISQDGINRDGIWIKRQNFKVVSWDKIAKALNLQIDTKMDPRKLKNRS
jgi:3-phytase